MESTSLVFGLFVLVVGVAALARRLSTPYPVLLVLLGLLLALVPGLPEVRLDPELVLFIFLPPLLYAASLETSLREVRDNLRPLLVLAVGLVVATAAVVGVVVHALVPGLSWAASFTLGAIVSPPDPVAATAVASRLRLPRRIVTILAGEGLFNDATALVLFRLTSGAVVGGGVSLAQLGVRVVVAFAGAAAIGLAVAAVVTWVVRRIEDPTLENTVAILVPFAAYLPAERIGASGVLAVLVTGLALSRFDADAFTPSGRRAARTFYATVEFGLAGLSFLLIGLQLRPVVGDLGSTSFPTAVLYTAATAGAVVGLRLVWVPASAALSRRLHRPGRPQRVPPDARSLAVISWAGMRGVVSLAAALALPLTTDAGDPFPRRSLLVFIGFGVILATLLVQGLTLPPFIRLLGVGGSDDDEVAAAAHARLHTLQAAREQFDELVAQGEVEEVVADRVREMLARRDEALRRRAGIAEHDGAGGHDDGDDVDEAERDARREEEVELRRVLKRIFEVERSSLARLESSGEISAPVAQDVLRGIDIDQAQAR